MTYRIQRPRRRPGPDGLTRTISKIIARVTHETGHPPSDEAIARLLAISTTRVQFHRHLRAGGQK